MPLGEALRRVTAEPVRAPHPLPGFARSTVDGYAVRAADTYGASEGLPGYLTVTGAVRMGAASDVTVTPGAAVSMPTGGAMPTGADAVVMIEYTAEAVPAGIGPGTIEVVRPVAPGEGVVRADEDVVEGKEIIPNGSVLRPQDLGMLAAAGVTSVRAHARPVVTIFSTGDEVVPPDTAALKPGQVRDATASALAALVADVGGTPVHGGIVGDDPGALEQALRSALPASDVIVISAGSSVGTRDETANAVAALGPPGIWCHGLAIKPGKPTLLAECGTGPRPPGSRLSACRATPGPPSWSSGWSACRSSAWSAAAPHRRPSRRPGRRCPATSRRRPAAWTSSRSGARRGGDPLFGASALLSVLTEADGYIVIPEEATGLDAGTDVEVTLYRGRLLV